ncbi:hypothetical protein SAMN05421505_11852 [Sinosporangium album]|uniref:ABC-2 type transport system permease protein n=1 Tax=Sinosporangium album TaxID=504805 RepID=A0A1G8DHF0_9ACTN|nr:hypothetical protein [Sinosporangium album]SDH57076.1 hypothetical protein SAMN05421505_11852 [Sinosporangium album]
MTTPTAYAAYTRLEARAALRPHHPWACALLVVIGIGDGLLPGIPSIQHFFEAVFGARNGVHTILINDYTGLLCVIYWVGVFDLLRVYVTPAEERRLALYLTKPISRTRYFVSKLAPTMLILTLVNVVGMLAAAGGVLAFAGPADFRPGAFIATSLMVFALAVVMLAIANLAFLFVRDTYNAILVAAAVFIAAVLPGGMYMYRPDLFSPALKDLLVFPANLLWHEDDAPAIAAIGVPLMLAAAAVLTALAAWRLNRTDTIKA